MRFGLVGTGHWALTTHGAALLDHPSAELVGVWGRRPEARQDIAAKLDTRAYDTAEQLFDDVDAVAFAVPPDVQADLAVNAAAHGCHLLLDKPVALSSAAADAVAAAADHSGVATTVFFTSRFVDNIARWLTQTVDTDHWIGGHTRLATSIFEPGNPYGKSAWRKERGALWDIGPHALSLALPVLGPVESLVGVRGPRDAIEVALHHRSGASSTMSLTLSAPPGSRGNHQQFFGEVGTTVVPAAGASPDAAMRACIAALVDVAATGRQHPCNVHFGRDVVAVLSAAERFLARTQGGPEPVV